MFHEQWSVGEMNHRLKQARKALGYTQSDLAAMLGYRSKSGYAMIENGRNNPPLHIALKLSGILGSDVHTLFTDLYDIPERKGGLS
ncbi:transcriptional regulator [Paenibacillus sambharensis]|uniref:Transcriptional regulator n=2 Tax=Paenibacillus sambharensis TaxID=1803190 RepID=A0A2W1LTB6_9BACL|nr:transcriptional regulator [Paenibacillus sambharensis]